MPIEKGHQHRNQPMTAASINMLMCCASVVSVYFSPRVRGHVYCL